MSVGQSPPLSAEIREVSAPLPVGIRLHPYPVRRTHTDLGVPVMAEVEYDNATCI